MATEKVAPAEPPLDERVTITEGKVTSLEEQNTETKNDLSALKKLKLSGYVQGRYQYQESLDDTGAGGFSRFTVRVTEQGLQGKAWGEPLDRSRHELSHEVKAITYHGLRVEKQDGKWLAEVIVDI